MSSGEWSRSPGRGSEGLCESIMRCVPNDSSRGYGEKYAGLLNVTCSSSEAGACVRLIDFCVSLAYRLGNNKEEEKDLVWFCTDAPVLEEETCVDYRSTPTWALGIPFWVL